MIQRFGIETRNTVGPAAVAQRSRHPGWQSSLALSAGSTPNPDGIYCMSPPQLSPHFLSAYCLSLYVKYTIKAKATKKYMLPLELCMEVNRVVVTIL